MFSRLPIDRCLGCFHLLALLVNNAATNVRARTSVRSLLSILWDIPGGFGSTGSYGHSVCNFVRHRRLSSTVTDPLRVPRLICDPLLGTESLGCSQHKPSQTPRSQVTFKNRKDQAEEQPRDFQKTGGAVGRRGMK